MRRFNLLAAVALLAALSLCAGAFADVLPRTTTATRDIILVEEYEEAEESGSGTPAMDGEEKAARLDVEEMHRSDFELLLESDRSAEGDIFDIGDRIEFAFTSDRDCYLTLLNFTPSGQIVVLFPNRWVSDSSVKAGERIVVPAEGQTFSMKLGGPAGTDIVKAIATNIETEIVNPHNQKLFGPFAILEDSKVATRDIILIDESVFDDEEAPETPLQWAATSLAVFTKGDSPEKGGFGVTIRDGWIAKIWADRDEFLTGEPIFVKLQSNRPATLVSLVNQGASGRVNALLPEGVEKTVRPGGITILPGKEDKWKLVAATEPGTDVVTARLMDEDGVELEVSFTVVVEE
ncbi:MAG: DUF4384 domain-containing protein [Synergistaceae bacterium]|nr:DUF4384 domain-containing protein [Synergistota bacterium]NLM71500.1 DUF4384 domain-containing protein [Synergistaceae bacterium]